MMPNNDFVSECAIFITALVVCILANIIGLISIGELKFKPYNMTEFPNMIFGPSDRIFSTPDESSAQ